jgi:protein-tyrosine phosphatase
MAMRRKIVGRVARDLVLAVIIFIAAGNLAILSANLVARSMLDQPRLPDLAGIANLQSVDDHVWRGAAPSHEGYKALASHGVSTLVDLRAEEDVSVDEALLQELRLTRYNIPLRDGQAPSPAQVQRFLDVVNESKGRVFVHCGAGVGRTGTMAASYLVDSGQADSLEALGRNLAVGPPSLEQISFVTGLTGEQAARPPVAVSVMSRLIDGPRRVWVHLTSAYGG